MRHASLVTSALRSGRHVALALLWGALSGLEPSSVLAQGVVPAQGSAPAQGAVAPQRSLPLRGIALDARLAADHGVTLGDTVLLGAHPESLQVRAVVRAFVARGADPSEVARAEYRGRLHLTQLQSLIGYGDRVDRFAVATPRGAVLDTAVARINSAAFGFRAHRSADVAVETSATFAVLSRFQRAIGGITIVASATFLVCIMLLKVDERRRDVAALRMVGISRRTVVAAVVLEATLVALLGSALGAGLGALISAVVNRHYQAVYRTPLMFSLVTPSTLAVAVLVSVLVGITAGLVASLRLVRQHPLALLGR